MVMICWCTENSWRFFNEQTKKKVKARIQIWVSVSISDSDPAKLRYFNVVSSVPAALTRYRTLYAPFTYRIVVSLPGTKVNGVTVQRNDAHY